MEPPNPAVVPVDQPTLLHGTQPVVRLFLPLLIVFGNECVQKEEPPWCPHPRSPALSFLTPEERTFKDFYLHPDFHDSKSRRFDLSVTPVFSDSGSCFIWMHKNNLDPICSKNSLLLSLFLWNHYILLNVACWQGR